jgi:glutamate racemase
MNRTRSVIRTDSTGASADESFLEAMQRLCEKDNQDEDVLGLLAHIQKRLCDHSITTCTHADLLENSFKHGLEAQARGILISSPIAWLKQDCDRQIKKLKYVQQRKGHHKAQLDRTS